MKNNKSVGSITIKREKLGNSIAYTLSSKIKAKFIVEFDIEAEEKSIYKEGALVYSSIFRKLNDKVKLNQSLSLVEGQYVLKSLDATEALSLNVIYRNLITLFFNEPINVKKIYSDKFKKMISIIPLGNGKYKINFSHNTSNVYHYENGKCTMIEAKGPFYKVKLVPEIL
ncbi:hypothetical protein E1J38_005105 [Seonamhaeicola sediminis]|uniref:Uncharacterized protein n=1 Tax=Seonamhaeicola sediminis TaxID=2528206 RepID=A0A562YEZ4_9FLAO|nr:DUF6134 family protein [Seonamhaeicola sediminis]TWO33276.1 hypothetical protein E1J38_005105 [Seonamhaeicola sediminis]